MDQLISNAPEISEAYDTTRPEFSAFLARVGDWFGSQGASYADIDRDARARADAPGVFGFRVALKIAESQRILRAVEPGGGSPVKRNTPDYGAGAPLSRIRGGGTRR